MVRCLLEPAILAGTDQEAVIASSVAGAGRWR